VKIDSDGTVTLEPLVQEPHDHSQEKIIRMILYILLIVIGARLVVRLIRGRPSTGTGRETMAQEEATRPDEAITPEEATEPDASAPAPDASPKEE